MNIAELTLSARYSTSRRPLILLSLLYLLLPNVLFLLGWFRPVFSLPLSIALLISVVWMCYSSDDNSEAHSYFSYTGKDILKLCCACLLLVFLVDITGITGHVDQSGDFAVRNPIYHTLVRDAWPTFSAKGEYFIYYHSFWLPPAFISKILGGIIVADTILCIWVFLGLLLFVLLLFTRIQGRVLIYFVFLCMLGNVSQLPDLPYRIMTCTNPYPTKYITYIHILQHLGFGTKMRYFHFWGNIVFTFNSAVPALVCIGLFLSKSLPKRYFPIPAALLASAAPFCTLSLAPLLMMLTVNQVSLLKKMLSDIKIWCCVLLLLACGCYFMGQEASEVRFVWSDSEYLARFPKPFHLLSVRIACYIYIVLGCLIPAFLLIRRRLKNNIWFYTLITLALFLPLMWIGRLFNELLFKGSVYLFAIFAWLLTEEWRFSKSKKRIVIALFLLFSCWHLISDAKIRHWNDYSWDPDKITKHINSSWKDTLNHPNDYCYQQFWGKVLYPKIQYSSPGESLIK